MSKPIIYGPAYSTFARTVRLALEEKGADYDLQEVDILTGAHQSPEHLARHPFGKVPAFEHDGQTIYETEAIVRYVDAAFGGLSLEPADAKGKGRMAQVIGVINSYGYGPIIGSAFIQRAVMPMLGNERDETAIEEALPAARAAVAALEALNGGQDYMAGDSLSLADLYLVPVYDYFSQIPEGQKILDEAPNLAAWWGRMQDRPSVVKTKPQL